MQCISSGASFTLIDVSGDPVNTFNKKVVMGLMFVPGFE
jgi:hypothetical protein